MQLWGVEPWTSLIQHVFNPRDAYEIFQIPLTVRHEDDAPIWRYSKNLLYFVRSSYYYLMEEILILITLKKKAIGRNYGNLMYQIE
jgi:hypothetical protein